MTKDVIAALVAVAAFLGLFAWGQQGHHAAQEARQNAKVAATQRDDALEALRAANAAAETNRKLSEKRIATSDKQRKAAEARAKELNRALQDNPDWAASPVPVGVWDALGPDPQDGTQPAAPGTAGRVLSPGPAR